MSMSWYFPLNVWIVRRVTGIAKHSLGVLDGDHLREFPGLGRILFMTAAAEVGDIGPLGNVGSRVAGVGGQRTVAGFARDVRVPAGGADFGLVVVAHHTGILSCKGNGPLPDGIESAGAVVAVLSKSLGDDGATNDEEEADSGQQNQRWAHQMDPVMKQAAQDYPLFQKNLLLRWAGGRMPPA
jgi:hypothetical protein